MRYDITPKMIHINFLKKLIFYPSSISTKNHLKEKVGKTRIEMKKDFQSDTLTQVIHEKFRTSTIQLFLLHQTLHMRLNGMTSFFLQTSLTATQHQTTGSMFGYGQ